jgi:hypothetical protein
MSKQALWMDWNDDVLVEIVDEMMQQLRLAVCGTAARSDCRGPQCTAMNTPDQLTQAMDQRRKKAER